MLELIYIKQQKKNDEFGWPTKKFTTKKPNRFSPMVQKANLTRNGLKRVRIADKWDNALNNEVYSIYRLLLLALKT